MNKSTTSTTTYILWAVYISLLVVLLPHTAWAFKNWEPAAKDAWAIYGSVTSSDVVAYVAAFAFEAAIAVLTHKLSKRIEETPKSKKGAYRFVYQYLNAISFALLIATVVSALANLAHAVEFGSRLKIFAEWGIPFEVYSFAFGGILPLVSLTFARVLSNVVEDEEAPNPELMKANENVAILRQQQKETERLLKAAELRVQDAELRAKQAEARFGALGDAFVRLFGQEKRERILAARQLFPALPNSAIAVMTDASASFVSETLRDVEIVNG